MNKHPHRANAEMLLTLAWLSTQDLTSQWQRDQQARPWKYPPRALSWQEQQLRVYPEELVLRQIDEAIAVLHTHSSYDLALEALVRYRLIFVDVDRVSWSIELHEQTAAMCALYYAPDYSRPGSYSGCRQTTEIADEVDAIWQVVLSDAPFAERLNRLAETWGDDVCLGARDLQAFFRWYADEVRRRLQVPFLVWELLAISLNKVDWHALAANVLSTVVADQCCCQAVVREEVVGVPIETVPDWFQRVLTILNVFE